MIHIEGMGVLGSFLAWELHNRQVPFTWYDNLARANAWSACTSAIFPTGKPTDMMNYTEWWTRFNNKGCPWQKDLGNSFMEEAGYWFLSKNPPHEGNYPIDHSVPPLHMGALPSLHLNTQKFVVRTRQFFMKQYTFVDNFKDNGSQRIVAHGFSSRLKEYIWGWTVPVQLEYPQAYNYEGKRPCLYLRKGSFFQYAYPIPGTPNWYSGSSLIVSREIKEYDMINKVHTWLKWIEKFTEGRFNAEVVGYPVQGWRPRGYDEDTEEAVEIEGKILVRPHWHDGVRNGPSTIRAVLEKAGIEP
jgi:hypothetical protein